MRAKTQYQCQECGAISPKWAGQCADCGAWNTFVETVVEAKPAKLNPRFAGIGGEAPGIHVLSEVAAGDEPRLPTNIAELDRVLGGGIVAGSVVLIGGDPGIGKSTLLLQSLDQIGARRGKVLYVSGEESPAQIKLRADRLRISSDHLYILAETAFEEIIHHAQAVQLIAIVIDSIQTVYTRQMSSAPGSVTQI